MEFNWYENKEHIGGNFKENISINNPPEPTKNGTYINYTINDTTGILNFTIFDNNTNQIITNMTADLTIYDENNNTVIPTITFNQSNNNYYINLTNLPNGTYEVIFEWYSNNEHIGGLFNENITFGNPPKPITNGTYANYTISNGIICFNIYDNDTEEKITNMRADLTIYNEFNDDNPVINTTIYYQSESDGYCANISNLADGKYEVIFWWYKDNEHPGGLFDENITFSNPPKSITNGTYANYTISNGIICFNIYDNDTEEKITNMRADLTIYNKNDDYKPILDIRFTQSGTNGYCANISDLPNGTYEVIFEWYLNNEHPGGLFDENIIINNLPELLESNKICVTNKQIKKNFFKKLSIKL
jgi:hypothetical protein